jgi:hypothetical protein
MRERYWQNKHLRKEYGKKQRRDEKSDCRGNGGGTEKYIKLFS